MRFTRHCYSVSTLVSIYDNPAFTVSRQHSQQEATDQQADVSHEDTVDSAIHEPVNIRVDRLTGKAREEVIDSFHMSNGVDLGASPGRGTQHYSIWLMLTTAINLT